MSTDTTTEFRCKCPLPKWIIVVYFLVQAGMLVSGIFSFFVVYELHIMTAITLILTVIGFICMLCVVPISVLCDAIPEGGVNFKFLIWRKKCYKYSDILKIEPGRGKFNIVGMKKVNYSLDWNRTVNIFLTDKWVVSYAVEMPEEMIKYVSAHISKDL
ncbi:hypothetical protein ADUPG1_012489 [Aduncisulcus paluster]|uniref:Photosystem I assembly protein Ycf4 n=1 Tax=Aduncisulcus paluster TaxID=2918883 RepID=A0ABQ5K1H6_9EUKA|nr:hypothetical protein ADUPG1_012489 [Aduncisulcus paluster]